MQLGENGTMPVLVWMHGGGFSMGDSTDTIYGPEYLVNDGIVVVTFNYRLGPLGTPKSFTTRISLLKLAWIKLDFFLYIFVCRVLVYKHTRCFW